MHGTQRERRDEGRRSTGKYEVTCTFALPFLEFMGSAFSSNSYLGFGQEPAGRVVYVLVARVEVWVCRSLGLSYSSIVC